MARAMWTGIIGFGMVSIPVKLYAATESKSVSFNQVHKDCKSRIKELRWCPRCDRQIEYSEIEKGYEYAKDQYVTLTSEELEQLPLPSKNIIDVKSFVTTEEIDPIYYEKSYYLEPEKNGERPFNLFLQALEGKSMVAIGNITLRSRERLCALRTSGDTIIMSTLLYPDEIRSAPKANEPATKITEQELNMAYSLVDLLAGKFEPEKFTDHYREQLQKLIDSKLEGVTMQEAPMHFAETGNVVDLMDALRASLTKQQSEAPLTGAVAESDTVAEEKIAARSKAARKDTGSSAKTKSAPKGKRGIA